MKSLWHAALVLFFLHLMTAVGFIAWLYNSGRVDVDRLERVVAMFKPTIAEDKAAAAQAELEAEAQAETARQAARQRQIAAGPMTLTDFLEADVVANDIAQQQLSRMREESNQLRGQMTAFQGTIEERQAELAAREAAFDQRVEDLIQKYQEEDFRQVVRTYESLEPGQVKDVFVNLMEQGRTEDVIDYLAAMQLRKASAVLSEFGGGAEVDQVTTLIEGLRARRAEAIEDALSLGEDTP